MDTPYSVAVYIPLKDYILSNLGPSVWKDPMNIYCHPLRVEAWMLQLLTESVPKQNNNKE